MNIMCMVTLGDQTREQFMLLKCPDILTCFNTELSEQEQEQAHIHLLQWDTWIKSQLLKEVIQWPEDILFQP